MSEALALLTVSASLCHATSLAAQERLVRERTAALGASFETVSFGNGGLTQQSFAGLDSARVQSATQFSVPISGAMSLGAGWRLDITSLYASGAVRYRNLANAGERHTSTLAGISDVRVRVTGNVLSDALFLTVGMNAPTGRTALTLQEFATLRILAAPALGMGSAPVGGGASGTLGLVYARPVGSWSTAIGASYEHRGSFQPVAALAAGAPSIDYKPGAVVRTSLSAERTVRDNRLTLAMTADRFAEDKLHGTGTALPANGELARVQLGPVVSADAQMSFASGRIRNPIAFVSYRWRMPYQRDGRNVSGSAAQYVDAGIRGGLPINPSMAFVMGLDARLHTGLGVDQGLPTSGVASAGASAVLDWKYGAYNVQPFVRLQGGSLSQRNAVLGTGTNSFAGAAAGLILVSRF